MHGEIRKDTAFFRSVTDAFTRNHVRGKANKTFGLKGDRTSIRLVKAQDGLECGGLTGTIAADEEHRFARANRH